MLMMQVTTSHVLMWSTKELQVNIGDILSRSLGTADFVHGRNKNSMHACGSRYLIAMHVIGAACLPGPGSLGSLAQVLGCP
jgi:hypothetical protein